MYHPDYILATLGGAQLFRAAKPISLSFSFRLFCSITSHLNSSVVQCGFEQPAFHMGNFAVLAVRHEPCAARGCWWIRWSGRCSIVRNRSRTRPRAGRGRSVSVGGLSGGRSVSHSSPSRRSPTASWAYPSSTSPASPLAGGARPALPPEASGSECPSVRGCPRTPLLGGTGKPVRGG